MAVKIPGQKNDKQKMLIIAVIITLAILFLFQKILLGPLNAKSRELKTNLIQAKSKLEEAERVADQLNQLERDNAILQKRLADASTRLPREKEIPNLLKQVTTKANESSVRFSSFVPAPLIARDFYAEVPISINVRGNYHNLGLFFTRLGNLPRIVNVNSVQIQPYKSETGKESISASFILTTFIFLEGGGF